MFLGHLLCASICANAEETVEKVDLVPVLMGFQSSLTHKPHLLMTGNYSVTAGGTWGRSTTNSGVPEQDRFAWPDAVTEGFLEAVDFKLT